MVVAAVVIVIAVWVYVAWRIAGGGRDDVGSVEHQERVLRALGTAAREAGVRREADGEGRGGNRRPVTAPRIPRPAGPIGARTATTFDGDPVSALARSTDSAPADAARRSPALRARLLVAAAAVAAGAGVLVIVGGVVTDDGSADGDAVEAAGDGAGDGPDDGPDAAAGAGTDRTSAPTRPPVTAPRPAPPVIAAPEVEAVGDAAVRIVVPGDGFTARVVAADGPCWVGAELDGESVFAATLAPGEDVELTGADLTMRLGNAGVVRLEVDGEEVEFLGVSAGLPADVTVVAADA